MKRPVVALVGRPNVGKSTLFNRIVGKKISIIEDIPGITRDRIYSMVKLENFQFHLIDTGGIDISGGVYNENIKMQAELAIDEADIVLFVVDGKDGLNPNDFVVRDMLLKTTKKIIVVINKSDTKQYRDNMYDFYELGFDEYIPVSGEQNIGIYDLLESITKDFAQYGEDDQDDVIKFSIVGRPNVGKSSLVNALLNEDRVLVGDEAGTTRDAIDTPFVYYDQEFTVIDTAGMRRRGKIYESVEKYSLIRTLRAIDRSDVCVITINAEEGIIEYDKHIAGYAIDAGKAIVLVVNKWDTIDNKDQAMKDFIKDIRNNFQFISYAPIVFLSAKTRKRIHTLMPEIIKVYNNSRLEIKTSVLNNVIQEAFYLNLPPTYKGKRLKIYFANQVSTKPPTFNIQVNNKGLIHFSYRRYIENKIRESFNLEGTPIVIHFKNKGEE